MTRALGLLALAILIALGLRFALGGAAVDGPGAVGSDPPALELTPEAPTDLAEGTSPGARREIVDAEASERGDDPAPEATGPATPALDPDDGPWTFECQVIGPPNVDLLAGEGTRIQLGGPKHASDHRLISPDGWLRVEMAPPRPWLHRNNPTERETYSVLVENAHCLPTELVFPVEVPTDDTVRVTVELREGRAIVGHPVDEAGVGLRADVLALGLEGSQLVPIDAVRRTSGPSGFRIVVPPRDVTLVVSTEGRRPRRLDVRVAGPVGNVVLARDGVIRGQVRAPVDLRSVVTATLVPGADEVRRGSFLLTDQGAEWRRVWVRPGRDGSFELAGLDPSRTYEVRYGRRPVQRVQPGGATLDL